MAAAPADGARGRGGGSRKRREPGPSKPVSNAPAAPDSLNCPHLAQGCPGCTLSSRLSSPPIYHQAKAYFLSKGLAEFPLHAVGPIHGWRCRAKLAVRGKPGRAAVGLFAPGTHTVATAIPSCVIHHPRLNQAAQLAVQCINLSRIPPYSDEDGSGALRYLQLTALPSQGRRRAEEDPGAQLQLVLVCSAASAEQPAAAECRRLAQLLWTYGGQAPPGSRQPPLLHSIWLNFQPSRTSNAALGSESALLHGAADAWQEFGGARIALAPGGFVQANYGAMQAALADIHRAVPSGASVTEFHAGSGAIGLGLVGGRELARLVCVEVNPAAQEPFERAKALLPAAQQARVSYRVAAAGGVAQEVLPGSEVVVVDPPRKGLEPELLQALNDPAACASARTLIYLSCGFAALQRDCDQLLRSGGGAWELSSAKAHLFFPGTDSIECLAVFTKR